eukprot:TRINITY_DN12730_c0_g2_i1.p1 TRINITY_DN12730_c0_g2~~TRINITY_DN12730_c0_g2_i1.p1  ORF type:complete len:270 (+),score=54.49 TRINITY_DN12730_c0_g2_i1:100-909(+)
MIPAAVGRFPLSRQSSIKRLACRSSYSSFQRPFSSQTKHGAPLKIEMQKSPSAAVIFGHGLGDSPEGWAWQCQCWSQQLPWTRFVLPPAPMMPVSLNGGMVMPAWYDIHGLADRLQEPAQGIEDSRARWRELVESQASLVGGRDRVVLGGFSQGGAMALYTALQLDMLPLVAGVVCMSGYLPNQAAVAAALPRNSRPKALAELPVLLCHGTLDGMVSLDAAKRTRDALQELGLENVELKEYDGMGHQICEEEIEDVAHFLEQILPDVTR